MATFVGDVTGLQQGHYMPIKYTSSCWEDQRSSTECKIASKYCNILKTLGRGCTCKRTQQLPTLIFMTQQCWDLLRPFACSLQHWVSFTGKNNGFPFLDILGYLRIPIKIPNLAKWDKSQPGNSQPSSLVGTCLTLPNLEFLWVFFKYPKLSKNGDLLFFPVSVHIEIFCLITNIHHHYGNFSQHIEFKDTLRLQIKRFVAKSLKDNVTENEENKGWSNALNGLFWRGLAEAFQQNQYNFFDSELLFTCCLWVTILSLFSLFPLLYQPNNQLLKIY